DHGVKPNPVYYFITTSSTSGPASGGSNIGSTADAPTNLNTFSPTFSPTFDATAPAPVGTTPFLPPSILPPTTSFVDQLTQLAPGSGALLQNLSQTASGITATAVTTTKSATTKLNSTHRKQTSTNPKASTQTNVAHGSTTRSTTQTMQQSA